MKPDGWVGTTDRRADGEHVVYTMHQSWLGSLAHCPEQARGTFGKPHTDDEHSDSTALGTAVHSGIEYALIEKRDRGVATWEQLAQVIEHELGTLHWERTKYSDAQVLKLALACAHEWLVAVEPMVDPLHLEHKFRKLLLADDAHSIYVEGSVDCVDVDGVPWDWKTASRPYEEWEYRRWAVQPTVYCYALDASTFNYAVMAHGAAAQVFPVWRTEGHFSWLKEQAEVAVALLESGMEKWQLNDAGWWCNSKWCPLWAQCKGKHMPDDWTDKRTYTP